MDEKEYTPTQIHELICNTIEKAFQSEMESIVAVGEIDNFFDNRDKSGWLYFTLKDDANRIRCVVPPETVNNIKFDIENGSNIRVRGKFYIYRKDTTVELLLDSVEDAGPSEFEIKLTKLMDELDSKGILAKARSRIIRTDPPPRRIAIIAPTKSVAFDDICVAATGAGGLTLVPRKMGDYTAGSLLTAIKFCEEDSEGFDAIIISRGGGEDLSLYNDPNVVRTIAQCEIPVIAAIGHSSDRTMLDYIAAESLPTPTAAGDWLREIHQRFHRKKKDAKRRLIYLIGGIIVAAVVVIIMMWLLPLLGIEG